MVLSPARVGRVQRPRQWPWSSDRPTVGRAGVPSYLTVDWVLGQFGRRVREAWRAYGQFVREGIGCASPWEQLRGQIYLGREDWVAQHQPDRVIKEVPRTPTQTQRPSLTLLAVNGC